jgi:hypothetical protein
MKRGLDGWVVRGAPVAPVGEVADAAVTVLNAGATHVEVSAGDVKVVADKPAPKKKGK